MASAAVPVGDGSNGSIPARVRVHQGWAVGPDLIAQFKTKHVLGVISATTEPTIDDGAQHWRTRGQLDRRGPSFAGACAGPEHQCWAVGPDLIGQFVFSGDNLHNY